MTEREWTPGDVAMVDYGWGVERMMRDHRGWWSATTDVRDGEADFMSARPLVVVDPDDDAQVERLASQLVYAGYTPDTGTVKAALRTLLEPPRPVEPQGLGAVVEDTDGRLWVRSDADDPQWRETVSAAWEGWSEINVARVLSEGLAS